MLPFPEELFIYVGVWLYAIVARKRDLSTLIKKKDQRDRDEKRKVERGLLRSVLLELLLFAPVSATLLFLVFPFVLPLIRSIPFLVQALEALPGRMALYTAVGIVSYGFPFAAVRSFFIRVAQHTIREAIALAPEGSGKNTQVEETREKRKLIGSSEECEGESE